jgi:hypothetical protein
MGITIWRNLLPASWGQKLSSLRKKWCGHRRERSINWHMQSHLTFAFPGLSVKFMFLCISPLCSV